MSIERTYKIIGSDQAEAKFSVFPTGQLQIDFLHSICKVRAHSSRLRFDSRLIAGRVEAVSITYYGDTDTFWEVCIGKSDGVELREIIQVVNDELDRLAQ